MHEETYEDRFTSTQRWYQRGLRRARWHAKTLAGVPRTLLVETRWRLGDEIMALPVFETLRGKYPADHLAVLTNFPDLYERHPFVDAVNEIPAAVDRYIFLRGADRREYRLACYARSAGVPLPVMPPHLYYEDWTAPQLAALPAGKGPVVALCAGASWPTKRWPIERWRALARTLEERGCRIVELGRGEEPVGAGLCLVNQTTVREAACILHHAALLICCDSGLMHLALAAATPVVALFGPTDPDILIRDEPNFHPLRSRQECRGFWNKAPGEPVPGECPWNHACCLDSVSVAEVLQAVQKQLPRR
jgi:ADP-heptose:LPS heptosyltransferase